MTGAHSHCSFCGAPFPDASAAFPRTCANCASVSYRNPTPVAVVLVPVGDGLLVVRRSIPPRVGQLALPGGFINFGESWQSGAAREVIEETGLELDPQTIREVRVLSAPDSAILIFGLAAAQPISVLERVRLSEETSEIAVIPQAIELAFPLHTLVAREYFEGRYA